MTIGIADRVRPDIAAGDGLPDDLASHFIMLDEQRLMAREQGSVVAKAVDGRERCNCRRRRIAQGDVVAGVVAGYIITSKTLDRLRSSE